MPRLKDRDTLIKAVHAAISGMLPGPFGYAERYDVTTNTYIGLAIEKASAASVLIDGETVIVDAKVAEANRPKPAATEAETTSLSATATVSDDQATLIENTSTQTGAPETPDEDQAAAPAEEKPTRFVGTVFLSADRPARDMGQIVEAIVEQLTTLPGADVTLKLEIDAEAPSGLDRSKVRTLMENASTLGFVDKSVE